MSSQLDDEHAPIFHVNKKYYPSGSAWNSHNLVNLRFKKRHPTYFTVLGCHPHDNIIRYLSHRSSFLVSTDQLCFFSGKTHTKITIRSGCMRHHFTARCRSFPLHVHRNKPALCTSGVASTQPPQCKSGATVDVTTLPVLCSAKFFFSDV